jgi:hypothetical protein
VSWPLGYAGENSQRKVRPTTSGFTLTQNALTDGTYLQYLRLIYGKQIYVPSEQESQQTFQDYLGDNQHRLEHDRQVPDLIRELERLLEAGR